MTNWKLINNDGDYVATDGVDTVELGDDLEAAQREFSLRTLLDDWTSVITSTYDEKTLEINPPKKKHGASPAEIVERVALVRKALDLIGVDPQSPIATLRGVGYKTLSEAFYEQTPELTKIGLHDLVNTLYFLIDPASATYKVQQDYRASLIEAWNGEPVIDRREEYPTDDGEYLVVTDEEADELWDQDLENYIDECLELPPQLENYFDREKWKRDARIDGRGHSLARYDGGEDKVRVELWERDEDGNLVEVGDHETYYIYRQN